MSKTQVKFASKNKRTINVGPSFSSKTSVIKKFSLGKPDQDIYMNIKWTPELEQYSDSKIKNKEFGEGTKSLNKNGSAIKVFGRSLGSSIYEDIDQFFIRKRQLNLGID